MVVSLCCTTLAPVGVVPRGYALATVARKKRFMVATSETGGRGRAAACTEKQALHVMLDDLEKT